MAEQATRSSTGTAVRLIPPDLCVHKPSVDRSIFGVLPTLPPRFALFVLEALPNARAVRRFVEDHAGEIAFVGLSNAERPNAGGLIGQTWRQLRRAGPGILPYLATNFGVPDIMALAFALTSRLSRAQPAAEATPLKALCRRYGIPSLRIDDVNGPEVAAALARHAPDLVIAFHFDQIFSGETLALAKLGGLNVHPSLLPRHRGPVPTMHALADGGEPAFGVTVHRLVPRIDAGSILAQEAVSLPPGTSATGAAIALHERGRVLLDAVLERIGREGMPAETPVPTLPYCPFPTLALLRKLRRNGHRLTQWSDVWAAVTINAGSK